jgi:replication factor A1
MNEYDLLLCSLVNKSGLPREDVKIKIEEKKESLGHLINDEVAVRLVAKDLGVPITEERIDKPTLKIEDLVPGINNVTLRLRVERTGNVKEFSKKDGTIGKLARISASDETGKVNVCFWDDNTNHLTHVGEGTLLMIFSAYTKPGLNGDVEVHLGNKARVEVLNENGRPIGTEHAKSRRGRLCRIFDPIEFNRKDGSPGRVIAFILRNDNEALRILVWDPTDELIMSLREGVAAEIHGGVIKNDLKGEPELHVNRTSSINIDLTDFVEAKIDIKRLSEIQPDMVDFAVEGYVENDFAVETTFSGKNYAKVMMRDGETVLPITFWNGKAFQVKRMVKPGALLRIEGCYTKFGPYGLEINVNKWSRIKTV